MTCVFNDNTERRDILYSGIPFERQMELNETIPIQTLTYKRMNSVESSFGSNFESNLESSFETNFKSSFESNYESSLKYEWQFVDSELSMDEIIGQVVEERNAFKKKQNLSLNKFVANKKLNKNSCSRIFLEWNVANMLELSRASIMAF